MLPKQSSKLCALSLTQTHTSASPQQNCVLTIFDRHFLLYIAPSIASVWRMPSSRAAFLRSKLAYSIMSSVISWCHILRFLWEQFDVEGIRMRFFCYAHCHYAHQHVFGASLGNGPLDHCAKVFYRLLRHESSDYPRNERLLYSWHQLTNASWINRKTVLLQLLRDCTFLPIVLMQQLLAVPFVVVDNMC